MDDGAEAQIWSYSVQVVTLWTRGKGIKDRISLFYLFFELYPLLPITYLSFEGMSLVQQALAVFWWFPLTSTLSSRYSIAFLKKKPKQQKNQTKNKPKTPPQNHPQTHPNHLKNPTNQTAKPRTKPPQNTTPMARQNQAKLFLFEELVSVSMGLKLTDIDQDSRWVLGELAE